MTASSIPVIINIVFVSFLLQRFIYLDGTIHVYLLVFIRCRKLNFSIIFPYFVSSEFIPSKPLAFLCVLYFIMIYLVLKTSLRTSVLFLCFLCRSLLKFPLQCSLFQSSSLCRFHCFLYMVRMSAVLFTCYTNLCSMLFPCTPSLTLLINIFYQSLWFLFIIFCCVICASCLCLQVNSVVS